MNRRKKGARRKITMQKIVIYFMILSVLLSTFALFGNLLK